MLPVDESEDLGLEDDESDAVELDDGVELDADEELDEFDESELDDDEEELDELVSDRLEVDLPSSS